MASDNANNALGLPSARHESSYHTALIGATRAISELNPSAIVPLQPNTMQFSTIRLNTDLNHLPRDWAKTKFQGYGASNNTRDNDNAFSAFTSLNLAHNHLDLVGRVDVISSSKNIKDLLKMPYQQSPHISLMVHRIGKTLLLEEFDVHKNLIKKESEQWQWLNEFFHRFVKKDDKNSSLVSINNSPKEDLMSDWMYCNLIRHSITASVANNACTSLENSSDVPLNMQQTAEETQDLKGFHHESVWRFHDGSMLVDSDLPIFGTDSKSPCISLRLRDSPPINVLTGLDYWLDNLMSNVPEVAMVYHLNGFVQKYEILRTEDIPNLENSKFDQDEVMELAHNVMAFIKNKAAIEGHTYWLYKSEHDDTVKLYNLTEYCKRDLRKDDNPFTVPVGLLCYNVGRNVRGPGEKRVAIRRSMLQNCLRLLDAESHPEVCADAHFMLADMWVPDNSLRDVWGHQGRIRDQEAEASDDDFDSEGEADMENEDDGEDTDNTRSESQNSLVGLQNMSLEDSNKQVTKSPEKSPRRSDEKNRNEVMVKELMIRGVIKRKSWDVVQMYKIAGEMDERCRIALDHIRKGLGLIDKDLSRRTKKSFNGKERASSPTPTTSCQNGIHSQNAAGLERDQLQFAKPFVPIPLHYSPINPKNSNNEQSKKSSSKPEGTSQNFQQESESNSSSAFGSESDDWHTALKLKLLRKAALAFSILAMQFHDSLKKRGHTMRYVRYGLHCYECLFHQESKRRQPDALEEEVYLRLIHLAGVARSCMDNNGIASNKNDFEEMREVEAAILHSAQAIVQQPKEEWVYKWPENEQQNLIVAKELFLKMLRMKFLNKKAAEELLATVKTQYGVCILNIGHIYRKQMDDRIEAGALYSEIEPLMGQAKSYYEEAVNQFLSLNEKNTAGQWQAFIAKLYEGAAGCLKQHTKDPENPVSKEEFLVIDKMMTAYDKALSICERDESADQYREEIYHAMRDKWYSLATRYFYIATPESYRKAKELLQKSLSYCFLDKNSKSARAFNSYRIGAIDHFNIAVLCDRECRTVSFDTAHHRSLRRKLYDHAMKAFELYGLMRWSRSQISVKLFVVTFLKEEHEKKTMNVPVAQRKNFRGTIRGILWQFTTLKEAVDCMSSGQADERDDSNLVPSQSEGIDLILQHMSLVLQAWLFLEKNTGLYKRVKETYRLNCRLLQLKKVEPVAQPLSQLLTDIDILIADANNQA